MNKRTCTALPCAALLLSLFAASAALAVDTRTWEQSDAADFSRGTRKNLSVRSDGRLALAPEFKELDSTGIPYLWALAQDSRGTLYYAGGAPTGATTKVMALAPSGKPKIFADLNGLEVHALAVDKQDRVYAAVLPDAKIYRIDHDGSKPQLFFDPKCKYIWSMLFAPDGSLFVGTGDSGLIYKVAPDGKGTQFFDTQESHARSMVLDSNGNLIVGTEPGGLVLRITPAGQGFVVYQTNKREVTAVAEQGGLLYACSVGNRTGGLSVSGPSPILPAPTPAAPVTGTGTPRPPATPTAPSAAPAPISATVTGGSECYRIEKDGFASRLWGSSSELVYALTFDNNGKPLVGTGNGGTIYRIDSDQLSTELLTSSPTQVTAFLHGGKKVIYAVTGNLGSLYSIGPEIANSGTFESEVLDTKDFAYWGKAHITPREEISSVKLESRSGNVNNPQNNWSEWSSVPLQADGGKIAAPPARFLQYRLTLTGADCYLTAVDIPFLPKNVAPKILGVEVAPANYRQAPSQNTLERNLAASGSPLTLTLPPVGIRKQPLGNLALDTAGSSTLQYSKGALTVRWAASDANNDPLIYRVEIREAASKEWQLLKDKLIDRFYSFDSSALPDGQYMVRITASDAPGNTPANALTGAGESDSFTIDNTAPEILDLTTKVDGPHIAVSFTAADALSWIDKAEYSVDGSEWTLLEPVNKVSDSRRLSYAFQAPTGHTIAIRLFDEADNAVVKQVR